MQYDIPSDHHQGLPLIIPLPKTKRKRRKAWHGSKWIRRARRLKIYARDRWRCVWCRCRVAIGAKAKEKHLALAQLDHVRPRSSGGSNATENLITCCNRCNKKRGATHAVDFARRMNALTRLVEAITK